MLPFLRYLGTSKRKKAIRRLISQTMLKIETFPDKSTQLIDLLQVCKILADPNQITAEEHILEYNESFYDKHLRAFNPECNTETSTNNLQLSNRLDNESPEHQAELDFR